MRATVDHALDLVEQIDWQQVILNLRNSGVATVTVADKIGMAHATAQHYAAGRTSRAPSMKQALQLLDLHIDRCPDRHDLEQLKRKRA